MFQCFIESYTHVHVNQIDSNVYGALHCFSKMKNEFHVICINNDLSKTHGTIGSNIPGLGLNEPGKRRTYCTTNNNESTFVWLFELISL